MPVKTVVLRNSQLVCPVEGGPVPQACCPNEHEEDKAGTSIIEWNKTIAAANQELDGRWGDSLFRTAWKALTNFA